MSHAANVRLPDFGPADALVPISTAEHLDRLAALVERMTAEGLEYLLVYADREHSANMAFLIGFEPRFEEAVLLLDRAGRRTLLVGNECMGYLPDEALGCQVVLFQDFSLMGQPRDRSPSLRKALADFGISRGARVGTVGWKYYQSEAVEDPRYIIEVPAFIVDTLRELTGGPRFVRNAGRLLMDPQDGLRLANSPDQIARFEYASVHTSTGVLKVLKHLREGVREVDLERFLQPGGLPLSCHVMIGFGEKARRGLASPSDRVARVGDVFTIGFGVWGALTSRAGAVARGADDLAADVRDFYGPYVANYFDVVAEWYERVRVGAVAGEVFDAAGARRDDRLYHFAVNPGHYIHLDEWVHSPFFPGSTITLRSGMALQMDIIPVSNGPFCYANAEDGIVLADEALRREIAGRHPGCWRRMQRRREFMIGELGIRLDESVLPLSNIPGWLPPHGLDLDAAMVNER